MDSLKKEQAFKIAEITSSIYEQGHTWVFKEFDLDSGLTKLTRGLSLKVARKRLKSWRKERVELLLRGDGNQKAYVLRAFHANPNWNGEGVWQWFSSRWYTTYEEAAAVLEKKTSELELAMPCEVVELRTEELPGHFAVG